MNIAVVFRKLIITFCIILLSHLTFHTLAFSQNLNISPAKKNSHPKISSHLQNLEKNYKEGIGAQKMVAQGLNISLPAPEKVSVYLMSAPGTSIDEDTLDNLGAQIIKKAENVIKAKVPINMLTAVADNVDGVSFMKAPDKLIPVAVTSEGVNLTGADNFHIKGYDGTGVNVAVFDVGFIGLSNAISNNELPGNIVRVDCTKQPCDSNNPSIENTSSHGTAVAEIIHDMAPGAKLYLIQVSDGQVDLEDAKNFAAENEIMIINMSLVVPNTNFYDGECWELGGSSNPVCTADDAYFNKNILWVNAAGNEAQKHYEANFSDPDNNGWHNVSGSDEAIYITASAGDTIEVYLTWDAWDYSLTTDQDYDLYLYNSSDIEVDSSLNPQVGAPRQTPTEKIVYLVPNGGGGAYYLGIRRESGSPHRLEVYSIYHNLSPAVASSSLLGPADAAGAMAVGAIAPDEWKDGGKQEDFSSQGPTNDGRKKPDIMGPDKVYSYTLGSIFSGTSASCAHVSGAAALILNKHPGILVDQLRKSLTSTAIDMGASGKDNIYGYGRLNLDIDAPIPSSTTVTTVSGGGGGGGCFIAAAAYGSYAAPSVLILRKMRDHFLLTNSIGKSFVSLYYKYSPPMAKFIANHGNVKILVRLSLLPLVGISWLALKIGPLYTLSLLALFVFGLTRLISHRMLKRRKSLARRAKL
jgi:subtilisin family serine protease